MYHVHGSGESECMGVVERADVNSDVSLPTGDIVVGF